MKIVVLGLSLSSSWGNGHATTFRALLRAFAKRGHEVLFLERDVEWYAAHRDCPEPDFCELALYRSLDELARWRDDIAAADAVMVGSYVPDGQEVIRFVAEHARGVTGFYDIDTPVTLAVLARGEDTYIAPDQVGLFDLYFSFTSGPSLARLEEEFGARRAVALHCSVDPDRYAPQDVPRSWDLSYLGTYSDDRQPGLETLLIGAARLRPDLRFAVAGSQYPGTVRFPPNVQRIEHLEPAAHAAFYSASRYTLNLTRADMVAAGWSPSVRLFEAAACGTAIISDRWPGIDSFFAPGSEIVHADSAQDVIALLARDPQAIGAAARRRVLSRDTAAHRAAQFEAELVRAGAPAKAPSPYPQPAIMEHIDHA